MTCCSSYSSSNEVKKPKDRSSADTQSACCWKKDVDEEETHFSDWTIILKSLEDEQRADKFHVHRYFIATGTCRFKKFTLEQENQCDKSSLIFLHTNAMVDAFPFILDYLYSEGSTLYSIYTLPKPRKDAIAILALARYLGLERLVGRLETYIRKKSFGVQGAGMSTDNEEDCKIAIFWLSEATRYSEDKAIEVILAFFARLYATTDDALRKVMLQDLSNEQVIKILKLSVEFLGKKDMFMQRRVQMEIDGSTGEENFLNDKFDKVLWTSSQKNYFSDWTINVTSLESEEKVSKFHVHRACVTTGKYRSEYFLTLWTMQGYLKEHETCTSEIRMCDDMIDLFPFVLNNLYGESVEKCFTLNSKYRYGALTVLALARYFFVENLVKDVENYIKTTCAKRVYDEELCKQIDFWVSAAKIYGETMIFDHVKDFCERTNRTLESIFVKDVIETETEVGRGVEVSVTYLDNKLENIRNFSCGTCYACW